MSFAELKYIHWTRERIGPHIACPLNFSGIRSLYRRDLEKLGFRLADLEISGETSDVPGLLTLRQAVARQYHVSPENVTLTDGATMGFFLSALTLLTPGDEVIVEHPCYEPIPFGLRGLGARIKWWHRRFDQQFQPDLSALKKLLTRRVRAIYLTNFHNPSGARIAPEMIQEISRLARRVGAYVVSNETYLEFLLEKRPPPACTLAENIITVSSLTKAYGLGWIRPGWILAHQRLTKQFLQVLDHVVGQIPFPSQTVTLFALKKLPQLQVYTRRLVAANFPIMKQWMASQPDLRWVEPAGGVICFVRLPVGINSRKFVGYLQRTYRTVVVPGEFFGAPGYLRIGYGCATESLVKGLDNISRALEKYRRKTTYG